MILGGLAVGAMIMLIGILVGASISHMGDKDGE